MSTHVSKLAKTIGLAAGLLLIGGSLVGGIALAADNGDGQSPAVTGTATPTGDRHGDDQDADDQDGTHQDGDDQDGDDQDGTGRGGHDDCDEADASDDDASDDCATTPTATPSPSRSHDAGDHGDDD